MLSAIEVSAGSTPANAPKRMATSVTVLPMGPAVSCVADIGIMPVRLHSPTVGFNPTRPFTEEGETIEPSVSVPIAIVQRLADAADPEPALEWICSGLQHLPIYLAINPYGDKTFSYFLFMFIGCFAISIIETWLYKSTKGSLFVCILFHNAINTSAAYFYGNLKGTEFRPLIILVVLLVVTAISIGFKTRGTLTENRPITLTSYH